MGDRSGYLEQACLKIAQIEKTILVKRSSIYLSEPIGPIPQDDFLNMAVMLSSQMQPHELLHALQCIELDLGRKRIEKWGPRQIDLDILFWGDVVIQSENLVIPHPQIIHRLFVLFPMREIAPEFISPDAGKTIKVLLDNCPDSSNVRLYHV